MKFINIKDIFEENRLSFICVSLFFVFNAFLPIYRVGDGSEYILQFYSLANHATPWISGAALSDYANLFLQNNIQGLVPGDVIASYSNNLMVDGSFDLRHFWFYAFLAAVIHTLFFLINVPISVTFSFLILNAFLLFRVLKVSGKFHGVKGQISVLSLYVLSPMLWYGNKIHTEFFTFTLVTLASVYFYNKKILQASIAISIISTQNISFSVIALMLLLYYFFSNRQDISIILKNSLLVCVGIFLALLHPLYYLVRQSVITPQLLTGEAQIKFSFQDYFVWFFDPDIGLLPNWPLGILLLIYLLYVLIIQKSFNREYLLYATLFITISLYAQQSTTNLNTGGTPGPARYGLWYIGLFFPLLLNFATQAKSFSQIKLKFLSLVLAILMVLSLWSFSPRRFENYLTPSVTSTLIQTYFASLYSPNPEVFRERFSGFGESIIPYIVVGPSCTKLLLTKQGDLGSIYIPSYCGFSSQPIVSFVANKKSTNLNPEYIFITKSELSKLRKD